MTKRVLVTGAAGFIGSNLMERCMHEGWQVLGVDDFSNGRKELLPKGAFCIPSDFSDVRILDMIKKGQFDAVMHLAAVPRVGYSVDHPVETNNTNVSKTLLLIDACRNNIDRFVFASSSSVYGGADDLPTHEWAPKRPASPYALQKSVIEDYLDLYNRLYGFSSISLRFFNVFGPRQLGSSPYACAVSAWLTAIMKGESMRSDGDGTQSRDLCYVDNVTDACVRAANADLKGLIGGINVNVACGDRVTNNKVMAYLKKLYPYARSHNAPWRPGDVMHTQADVERAKTILGYEPLVRVWDGIDHTIEWYEANKQLVCDVRLSK